MMTQFYKKVHSFLYLKLLDYVIQHFIKVNVPSDRFSGAIFPWLSPGLSPPNCRAPLYKSLGLMMRPATAEAAATAGLAR
jgi:hypothetical protein